MGWEKSNQAGMRSVGSRDSQVLGMTHPQMAPVGRMERHEVMHFDVVPKSLYLRMTHVKCSEVL